MARSRVPKAKRGKYMKKILPLIALTLVAACNKAEEATVVEAVPASENEVATEAADAPAIEMPAEEAAK